MNTREKIAPVGPQFTFNSLYYSYFIPISQNVYVKAIFILLLANSASWGCF